MSKLKKPRKPNFYSHSKKEYVCNLESDLTLRRWRDLVDEPAKMALEEGAIGRL